MKKFFKITFLNIILIVIVLISIEFLCFYRYFCNYYWIKFDFNIFSVIKNKYSKEFKIQFKQLYTNYFKETYWNNYEFRKPNIINLNKKSILLLGCSFTYGEGLNKEETFSYKLANHTNYNVYNYGITGGSPKEALYMLSTGYLKNKIQSPNSIKYVIYTIIPDHIRRISYNHRLIVPQFIKINNKLIYIPNSHILQLKTIQNYKRLRYNKQMKFDNEEYFNIDKLKNFYNQDLLKLYFLEINRHVKKQFPNAKLIILNYENLQTDFLIDLNIKYNIPVINTFNILNINISQPEYQISQFDLHPNAKAWDVIVPALAKELNL